MTPSLGQPNDHQEADITLDKAQTHSTEWPGRERRYPGVGDSAYLQLREITRTLLDARDRYLDRGSRILDVGCGVQPYYPLFADFASVYDGNDVEPGPRIRYVSPVESLPMADGSYDAVLCTQVLEHVRRPHQALTEMTRVLTPGGHLFLTTHGVYPHHPDPADYWRWTQDGLVALVEDVEGLELIELVAHGGSVSTLAVLVNTAIREAIRSRSALAPVGTALIAGINGTASFLDGLLPTRAREALIGNFLIVARRASSL